MTDWHPLDDPRQQVATARAHVQGLGDEMGAFFNEHSDVFTPEVYMDGPEYVIKLANVPNLPIGWGVRFGEIANACRTALDYLVYELSVEGGGDPERERTAFPIAIDRDEYWKLDKRGVFFRDRCLAGVEDTWKREIDELQPYNRTQNPRAHPLHLLNVLSNRGKHRKPHPPFAGAETPREIVIFKNRATTRNLEVRFSGDDCQVKLSMKSPKRMPRNGEWGVVIEQKAYPDKQIGMTVVFGKFHAGLGALIRVVDHVEFIVERFEPAFEPPAE